MCFYCVNLSKISAAPASAAKKKERISTQQSVRRSARFLRDASFAESLMFEDEMGFLLKDSLDAKTNETRWRQITPEPVEDKSSPCAEPNKERLINRQSSDISLPDCVRRSLTGEFVPGR